MKNITKTHLSNRTISSRFVRAIEMIAKASINCLPGIITITSSPVLYLYPHPKLPPPVGLPTVIRQISSTATQMNKVNEIFV
jgi:hypothetical protein